MILTLDMGAHVKHLTFILTLLVSAVTMAEVARAQTGCDSTIPNESGLIREGLPLSGPIIITSLLSALNPAAPDRRFVVWNKNNSWISVESFNGPFFLARGEQLVGRNDFTKDILYSGHRCRN
ncbi:MAG: hypothetical protein QOF14_1248 [Hyphomicrobiales bacterium]|jgi:hypothetical protein|nr:hypothetical protein [Hyphomicrobiales bacterium]